MIAQRAENEFTNVDAEISERMERIAKLDARNRAEAESRPVESDSEGVKAQVQEKMLKADWPKRHVLRALEGNVHGPAASKIDTLWPLVQQGDKLLLLVGNKGPGKTQIATSLAVKRVQSGKLNAGLYIKFFDLIMAIKKTWNTKGVSEEDALQKFRGAGLLCIDEMQECEGYDFEMRYLTNILDHRYDDMKTTIIIANLGGQALEQALPASVVDRANETGGVVRCNWASYRTGGAS